MNSPDISGTLARKWPRRLRWLAVLCLLTAVLGFAFRAPLLTGLANAWIVNEPLEVASTYEESRAVRAWLEKTGAKNVIIPTDLFHTRRVRWLFQKQLKGIRARALVAVAPMEEYQATNWWQRGAGLIAFQNEVIKSGYYHLKY